MAQVEGDIVQYADRVLSNIHDAVGVYDEDGVCVYINDRPRDFAAEGTFVGKHYREFDEYLEEPGPYVAAFERVLQGESDRERIERTMTLPDTPPMPVDIRLSRVEDEGGVVMIVRDISERVAAEQAVEQTAEQLSILQRVVRSCVGNDLEVILGWCDRLRDHVATAGGRQMLERVELTAEYLQCFAEEAAEIEAAIEQDGAIETRPVEVTQLVEHELLKATCRFSKFTYEFPEDGPETTVAANALLGTALRGLLHTVTKHGDGETHVTTSFDRTSRTVTVRFAVTGTDVVTLADGDDTDEPTEVGCFALADQVITAFQGDLSVDADGDTTTIAVELPLAAAQDD
jgi:PAS domain S-box-containing protein